MPNNYFELLKSRESGNSKNPDLSAALKKLGLTNQDIVFLESAIKDGIKFNDTFELAPLFEFFTNQSFREKVSDIYAETMKTS